MTKKQKAKLAKAMAASPPVGSCEKAPSLAVLKALKSRLRAPYEIRLAGVELKRFLDAQAAERRHKEELQLADNLFEKSKSFAVSQARAESIDTMLSQATKFDVLPIEEAPRTGKNIFVIDRPAEIRVAWFSQNSGWIDEGARRQGNPVNISPSHFIAINGYPAC